MSQSYLLKNLKPAGPGTSHLPEKVDIEIESGKIKRIADKIESTKNQEVQVEDFAGAYVSAGWMDMHVHLREPGFEHKETIATGCAAAANGGFTDIACMPNTKPAASSRDVIEFIRTKAEVQPVDVHPIACVSIDREGKQLAEMADLKAGGAVAFSDDGDPVYDARLMRIALDYASMLDMPIINHEEDLALSRPGHMHEGRVSARLGVDATPGIAEEVMIARDIMLAELTGGHIHVAHISTAKAVELVRQAKQKGIKVTAEVCPHHFDLTDEEIERTGFDTNFKMHPPLRSSDDVEAMIGGLKDGTIDAICTDHAPHSVDEKESEFIYAPNGIIGLETAFAISCMRLLEPGHLSLDEILEKLIAAPRSILNIPVPEVKEGVEAKLTIFDTEESWIYSSDVIKSRSRNSPYLNETLNGRAIAVYCGNQLVMNNLKSAGAD